MAVVVAEVMMVVVMAASRCSVAIVVEVEVGWRLATWT